MNDQNQLALVKKDTVDVVATKVKQFQESGELKFPAHYSPENAMKSAWLQLQEVKDKNGKPALETCTKDSIANALLNMVVQGLSPSKNQCYFIPYGKNLTLTRSYFGTQAVTKRITGATDIYAQPVFENDELDYEIERGKKKITKHKQSLANVDKDKIVAAYATIVFPDDQEDYTEIMTMDQIKQAWRQSPMYKENGNGTHQKFTEEMAKKTVINRTCKNYINASDDSDLMVEHFQQTSDNIVEAEAQQEVDENANKEYLEVDMDTGEVKKDEPQEDEKEDSDESDEPSESSEADNLYMDFEDAEKDKAPF